MNLKSVWSPYQSGHGYVKESLVTKCDQRNSVTHSFLLSLTWHKQDLVVVKHLAKEFVIYNH